MKSSSGDTGGVDPYTLSAFWANPKNHFWETAWYSEETKEYYRKNIVEEALKELEKTQKEDLINHRIK